MPQRRKIRQQTGLFTYESGTYYWLGLLAGGILTISFNLFLGVPIEVATALPFMAAAFTIVPSLQRSTKVSDVSDKPEASDFPVEVFSSTSIWTPVTFGLITLPAVAILNKVFYGFDPWNVVLGSLVLVLALAIIDRATAEAFRSAPGF